MRRLLPEPAADLSVAELVAELRPWEDPPAERPHVAANFALTLDGHATLGGVSGAIGSERDTEMLVGLRTRFDAVLIGAGTMRAERYGRVVGDPAKRERRVELGLQPDPLVVIVSGRLDLPWDAPLFTEEGGPVVIVTAAETDPPETSVAILTIRQPAGVDLAAALAELRSAHGVRALLCEGGPRLNAQLLEAGLIDELFVTHAPKLAGGAGPGLVAGLPESERQLNLAWLVAEPESGELFARYRVPQG